MAAFLSRMDIIDMDDVIVLGTKHYPRMINIKGRTFNVGGLYYLLRMIAISSKQSVGSAGTAIFAVHPCSMNPDEVRCLRDPILAFQYIVAFDKFGITGVPVVGCKNKQEVVSCIKELSRISMVNSGLVRIMSNRNELLTELDSFFKCTIHTDVNKVYSNMTMIPGTRITQLNTVLIDMLQETGVYDKYVNDSGSDMLNRYDRYLEEQKKSGVPATVLGFVQLDASSGMLNVDDAIAMVKYITTKDAKVTAKAQSVDMTKYSGYKIKNIIMLASLLRLKEIRLFFDAEYVKPDPAYTEYINKAVERFESGTLMNDLGISSETSYFENDVWDNEVLDSYGDTKLMHNAIALEGGSLAGDDSVGATSLFDDDISDFL